MAGEIDKNEARQLSCLCNKIHLALYKYSESRINGLVEITEFRCILEKHSELWGDSEIKPSFKPYYNRILDKFGIKSDVSIK